MALVSCAYFGWATIGSGFDALTNSVPINHSTCNTKYCGGSLVHRCFAAESGPEPVWRAIRNPICCRFVAGISRTFDCALLNPENDECD